jgi:hypothetical protein
LSTGTVQVALPDERVTAEHNVVEPTVKVTVPVGVPLPLLVVTVAVMATVLVELDDQVTGFGLAVTGSVVVTADVSIVTVVVPLDAA